MQGSVVMIRGDGSVEVELDGPASGVVDGTAFEFYRPNPNCPMPEARDANTVIGHGVSVQMRAPGKRQKYPNNLNIIPTEGQDFGWPVVGDLVRSL